MKNKKKNKTKNKNRKSKREREKKKKRRQRDVWTCVVQLANVRIQKAVLNEAITVMLQWALPYRKKIPNVLFTTNTVFVVFLSLSRYLHPSWVTLGLRPPHSSSTSFSASLISRFGKSAYLIIWVSAPSAREQLLVSTGFIQLLMESDDDQKRSEIGPVCHSICWRRCFFNQIIQARTVTYNKNTDSW